jgi:hypothetical protein
MLYFAPVSLLSHSNFGYSMYPKLRFRSPVNLQGYARLELLAQSRHSLL